VTAVSSTTTPTAFALAFPAAAPMSSIRRGRHLGDGGDVVEQGGQPTSHESVSSS